MLSDVLYAVSLSGTMRTLTITIQAQRGRDLLDAHASGCHFFDGKELVCGKDISHAELLTKT